MPNLVQIKMIMVFKYCTDVVSHKSGHMLTIAKNLGVRNKYFIVFLMLYTFMEPNSVLAQSTFAIEYNTARICELVPHSNELQNCQTHDNHSNFNFDFKSKSITISIDNKNKIDLHIERILTFEDGLHIICADTNGRDVLVEVYDNGQIWLKSQTHLIIYQ